MENQVIALKVKVVSLMDEARRIRKEEGKARKRKFVDPEKSLTRVWTYEGDNALRESLYRHRVDDIRPEARCALLAYGFLRGVPYRAMERTTRKPVDVKRLRSLVAKFGGLPDGPLMVDDSVLQGWLTAPLPNEALPTSN